jgi:hypothetical protein
MVIHKPSADFYIIMYNGNLFHMNTEMHIVLKYLL